MRTRRSSPDRFAVCIRNEGYTASLEVWKIYRVLPDPEAAEHHCVRVVDESGTDYVYPADYFVPIELPRTVRQAMLAGS